ncbi:MAG TPA: methyltransferase [Solirubrobacteraceae bacterium]|nr:methyltransferase [Solirubrobacteraceae bacterium]
MADRPADEVIWDALRGGLVTRALALVADLHIAEALAGGPQPVADLARQAGADRDTLHRLLRALASDGIFAEEAPGVFRNTPASELLNRTGWDDFAHLFGGVWLRTVLELDATGTPSFPRIFGDDFWPWLAEHPRERAAFDRAMAQGWEARLERLGSVRWRGDETVVDVGGGNGALLAALVEGHPDMRGIVFDLPETVRDESALGERCTFVAGSFFEAVPPGDVFVLSGILHDWDDSSALRILRTVRAAAGEASRLILLEGSIEPGNEPDGAKWLDLLMLALLAGRERTEEQWRALLGEAGFELVHWGPGVIEARGS